MRAGVFAVVRVRPTYSYLVLVLPVVCLGPAWPRRFQGNFASTLLIVSVSAKGIR